LIATHPRGTTLPAGERRIALIVGGAVAVVAHAVVLIALAQSPQASRGDAEVARPAQAGGEVGMDCSAVVTPSCLTGEARGSVAIPNAPFEAPRRCPEPMRRRMRDERIEPAPAVTVDLLEAEIVERKGVSVEKAASGKPKRSQRKRVRRMLARKPSKLEKLVGGGGGANKKSKLAEMLGTDKGREDGDGATAKSGSAYVRQVRIAVQERFVLPGNVPPWQRKELRARVRIERMTATGTVLGWEMVKASGNDAFDKTVRALLNSYRAGRHRLPKPPPHILSEINARGMTIDLRGG
jgi:hypothetical protein